MARWDFSQVEGDAVFLAILALLVVSMFVVTPLEASGIASSTLVEGIRFAIAALIFLIVAKRLVSRLLILATFVATMLAFGHRAALLPDAAMVRPIVALVFDIAITGIVAAATFRPGYVSTRRILGGIILYLGIALVFAHVFALAQAIAGRAFSRPDASPITFADLLNYSLASMTSIGEARVSATSPLIQSLSQLETVIGQLFPATLLARLVGLNAAMAVQDTRLENGEATSAAADGPRAASTAARRRN